MKKQFLAKLLVLAMVLTMVPVTILAASAAAGDGNVNKDYDYSYSIAADTSFEALPDDGVFVLDVRGGVANLPLSDELVKALTVDDNGNIVLKIDAAGAEKVSVTLSAAALAAKSEDKDNGVYAECFGYKITIPGDQLVKAVKAANAKTVSIVIVPAAAGAEDPAPSVTVYLDWVATTIRGMTVKPL